MNTLPIRQENLKTDLCIYKDTVDDLRIFNEFDLDESAVVEPQ